MSKQVIGIGSAINDGSGDLLRTSFNKANLNFTELYTGLGGLLGKSGAAVNLTGSTAETALATITIPGNTISVNGLIRVVTMWSFTNSANNKTPRVRLGGIGGTVFWSLIGTTGVTMKVTTDIMNRNSASSQMSMSTYARGTDALVTTNAVATGALDTTASQDLVISGQLANSGETLTLEGYVVEYMN